MLADIIIDANMYSDEDMNAGIHRDIRRNNTQQKYIHTSDYELR